MLVYKYKMERESNMRDIINKIEEIENDANSVIILHEDVVALITDPDVTYTNMGTITLGNGESKEEVRKQIHEMCMKAWGHLI